MPFPAPWHVRTVVVLGKRGVGKSSTLNHLFGFDRPTDPAVECTVEPYARRVRDATGRRFRVVDMPGIAADADSLRRYRRHYARWLGRADTVVWITQANVRAYAQDQKFFREFAPSVRPGTRLVLALSKADTQVPELVAAGGGPGDDRDPLRRKASDAAAQIIPYTWARPEDVAIVPYSVARAWNTEELRSAVLAH
jgi:predicted GTPase